MTSWLGGVAITFGIALLGVGLSHVPGPDHVGPLACAILLAIAYRQIWGYPEAIRSGIQFSSKKLLRYAIILYGLKLNMDVVFHQGLGLLARGAGTILFAVALTVLLARWLKAERTLSLLLGIGTGVCGAAAIAAVSPIVNAKEEETAIGVGIIALVGTLFSIAYTILMPAQGLFACGSQDRIPLVSSRLSRDGHGRARTECVYAGPAIEGVTPVCCDADHIDSSFRRHLLYQIDG